MTRVPYGRIAAWLFVCVWLTACADIGSAFDAGESVADESTEADTTASETTASETTASETTVSDGTASDTSDEDGGPLEDTGEPTDLGPEDIAPDVLDTIEDSGSPDTFDGELLPDVPDVAEPDAMEPDVPKAPCDDDDPCTEDTEVGDGCENLWILGKCCLANPMCDDGDSCTTDICIPNAIEPSEPGLCTHEDSCCLTNDECDDGDNVCTTNQCVDQSCVNIPTSSEGCCASSLYLTTFDSGSLDGVTISNVADEVGWRLATDVQANSGTGSLWYGDPITNTFDNGLPNGGVVLFPAAQLPPGVESRFQFDIYADIEMGLQRDVLKLSLEDMETGEVFQLWDKQSLFGYNLWLTVETNLTAFAGRKIQIRMQFNTVDANNNEGQGVFLDNIQLTSTCSARECANSPQCDDGLGATIDTCAIAAGETVGICSYGPSSLYCLQSYECFDALPCTSDVCAQNQCQYPVKSNCCLSDADCSDGNPCTADDCLGGSANNGGFCNYVVVPGCCIADSQCNDGDSCTVDSCPGQGEQCENVAVVDCCKTSDDCIDGDACTEDLCISGTCTHNNVCCGSDDGCDDGDFLCTTDTCVDGVCQFEYTPQEGCCTITPLLGTFSGGGWDGFSVLADSNPNDGVGWFAVPNKGHTSTGALHYGDLGDGTYDTGEAQAATAVSPVVILPPASVIQFSFWVYIDNEYANGVGSLQWDRLTLAVVDLDSTESNHTVIWDSADGVPQWWMGTQTEPVGPQWTEVSGIDLTSFKGRTVRLQISFDTVDADANAFEGVYIDDLKIISTCLP